MTGEYLKQRVKSTERRIACNDISDYVLRCDETDYRLATITYRVVENDRGKLEWHANINGEEAVKTKEPLTSWWLRLQSWFMKFAPESQL